jgi:hypothetical protein
LCFFATIPIVGLKKARCALLVKALSTRTTPANSDQSRKVLEKGWIFSKNGDGNFWVFSI